MKKIIELAENICRAANPITRIALDIDRLEKELIKRKTLEQTPITEDWLREHGFRQINELTFSRVGGYGMTIHYVGCGEWMWITHLRNGIITQLYNLAQLLDACELCGINLEE